LLVLFTNLVHFCRLLAAGSRTPCLWCVLRWRATRAWHSLPRLFQEIPVKATALAHPTLSNLDTIIANKSYHRSKGKSS
jgi:hypothetical protein